VAQENQGGDEFRDAEPPGNILFAASRQPIAESGYARYDEDGLLVLRLTVREPSKWFRIL
jgi:hypothetical protein